jgi:hypothetical protein
MSDGAVLVVEALEPALPSGQWARLGGLVMRSLVGGNPELSPRGVLAAVRIVRAAVDAVSAWHGGREASLCLS